VAMEKQVKRFHITDLQAALKFFEENGFVIVKNFYSAEDLQDFKIEVKNIINAYLLKAGIQEMDSENDDILSNGILALEEKDHEYVAAIYDTIFQSPSFFRILGNRNTESYIKTLLKIDLSHALYGFTNRCRIDPPNDNRRTYGWHQEVFYTVPRGSYIQTWAPLIFDTTFENGTIEVAVGSQKEKIANQTWNELEGKATQILVDDNIVNKYEQQVVEMKVGEMLFFSGFLAHRSGNNTSQQVRYSLVGMYHDVKHKPFITPKLGFTFRKSSPKEYFEEVFNL
jgi:ectoine hydroxylase-related dioxygenase (phytanoyl-CoA dioxygenase family)